MCLLAAACVAVPAASAGGPTLAASPSAVAAGGTVTVSWDGVQSPTGTDWVGLYKQGAGDSAFSAGSTPRPAASSAGSAKASGSCTLAVPKKAGTYEFRLFASNGYTRLATSAPITVS